jgi:formylglycine-generating enzyme required for sulfatase activity
MTNNMKTSLLFSIGLLLSQMIYSQEVAPTGMVFCPQGSFKTSRFVNGDSTTVTITVDPFWMSNEVTNREYREFYNSIKSTPNDTIFWIDFKQLAIDKSKGLTKKISGYLKSAVHSEILKSLIDITVWNTSIKKENYKNYFSSPEFNDYPVLGVPYEGARLYCVWRTDIEKNKNKNQGIPLILDYRLPIEAEWEYAAIRTIQMDSGGNETKLHSSYAGKLNEYGLYNMGNNVSEWTASAEKVGEDIFQVVRGGSWFTEWSIKNRELIKPEKSTNYIGFRIVRSYLKE